MLNLAVNARDAMPAGGTLTIETHNVDLDGAYAESHVGVTPGPYVMLAVSDTGAGMTPEVKSRIVEPFTTKGLDKGTGLGLATVYGIVKQSKSNIWVYSARCRHDVQGVPASGARQAAARHHRTGARRRPRDDPHRRRRCRATPARLESAARNGYRVFIAADGQDAIEIVRALDEPIHLLLTDVVMPGGNGRMVAEQLRQLQPDVKVLFMSGYTDDAIAHHGVLEEGIDFLQKPFTPHGLSPRACARCWTAEAYAGGSPHQRTTWAA